MSKLAQHQLARSKDVRYMRGLTAVARHRWKARAAMRERQSLSQECEAKSRQLKEDMEEVAALRHRAEHLTEEVARARAAASSVAADAPVQIMMALQTELEAEDSRLHEGALEVCRAVAASSTVV